ncbi:uncharacterized protein C8A04DRAFT_26799 [Dichotomopilus funicola]|uniref:3-beta hydroxysteroid dehydrogenase/isomerase domain-containing protein n=1 Tax=Dichotomopilus funicola TaxID=1934379 RepID=A0AAN6V6A9_9PEZI|nr:hypothetical protein C8A04DRAFT_26799 [Dichotomopilus funicola]
MFWTALAAVAVLAAVWLVRINAGMLSVPEDAQNASPQRWTKQRIQEAYERVKKKPIDFSHLLPPRLERRYVIVGGSGLVGGDIVLQLLERGELPEAIRIVDFAPVNRRDMLRTAADCDFAKADITSRASVEAAFSRPWPESVAKRPLTVFHTAAAVRPQERSLLLYHRISPVNRDGAVNVLETAKAAGADVFIATSSASVGVVPPNFWIWPWQSSPKDYVQVVDEKDFDAPLRPHSQFFSNYGYSKAEAERAVCAANSPTFRTGAIRPGNPIYGQKTDPVLGIVLRTGDNVTWIPHVIQHFVNSRNVALAHLQFEAALAPTTPTSRTSARSKAAALAHLPACAGRPFNVTDPGPPIAFTDLYTAAEQLSTKPVRTFPQQPLVLFLIAHVIEAWCLILARFPFLTKYFGLREPAGPIHMLQPSVFTVSIHTIIDDSEARKSVEDGGIGYRPGCETLEGVCEQILEWNRENEGVEGEDGPEGTLAKAALMGQGVAA